MSWDEDLVVVVVLVFVVVVVAEGLDVATIVSYVDFLAFVVLGKGAVRTAAVHEVLARRR